MTEPSLTSSRQFAVEVVRRLREAGFEAVWAGGCVRDQLLGRTPKDYDVATDARPEQIRDVFGRRRTLAIGAAFGVITVVAPRGVQNIEAATFRNDAAYSDGRHPDSVSFSDAEQDAQRRDFTINGLFFDPLDEQVIDYVGGIEDLTRGIVRAIGDPEERIAEDKLRMLRAVRFTATFAFRLDPETQQAIARHASDIKVVSAERIAQEMRRMLEHPYRKRAVELLRETGLLAEILPESKAFSEDEPAWERLLSLFDELDEPPFATALTVIVREIWPTAREPSPPSQKKSKQQQRPGETICRRWKLSNEETDHVAHLLSYENMIRRALQEYWPNLQRLLTAPLADELLDFAEATAKIVGDGQADVLFCREKRALPVEVVDPSPLITGEDLQQMDVPPGPIYKKVLEAVRDAQLLGKITTVAQARELAKSLMKDGDLDGFRFK